MGTLIGLNGGAYGLFVAPNGVNPRNENWPPNDDRLLFSSQWEKCARIHATGTVPLETNVGFPQLPFRPLIRWEQIVGATVVLSPQNLKAVLGNNRTDRYSWSRFEFNWVTSNVFRIDRSENIDTDTTGTFRYIVFTLSVDD